MLIIPAIDLKDGQCVRLKQGRMEDATVYGNDPAAMAAHWVSQGCRHLHLVDLNGAFAGEPINGSAVAAIAQAHSDLPIQIGGGIRSLDTIEYYLNAGVTYCIIGTKAVSNPEFVRQCCREFPGHIMVGLDARDGWVATSGWAETSNIQAADLAQQLSAEGVSAIVYTDISRDGMLEGVNWEATLALAAASQCPVIASGGVTNMTDVKTLAQLQDQGLMGAITGRAIYEGTLDLKAAQAHLDHAHSNTRGTL